MEPTEHNPREGAPKRRLPSAIVAAGAAFGLTLAGLGVAAAQTGSGEDAPATTAAQSETTPSTEPAPTTPAQEDNRGRRHHRDPRRPGGGETALTGETADKVSAAALAAVPGGTILRVETDSDGSPYEAHVRTADGTEVVVKVNESFEVTSVEEHTHPGLRPGEMPAPESD